MKQFFLLIFFIPALAHAQVKKTQSKAVAKTTVKKTVVSKKATTDTIPVKPVDGYLIKGSIKGQPDGALIKMLNGSNGAEEQSTVLKNGKFYFTGKTATPDFKFFGVNGQPPYLIVFLDNSEVTIAAKKDSLATAEVKGSASQRDFVEFTNTTKPYENLMMGQGRFDVGFMDKGAQVLEDFINTHKNSFVTPLAIYRHNMITGDYGKLEEMYNSLAEPVKASAISNYLSQIIAKDKEAAYGKPVADFTQPDTSGKNIRLSSFKGKYVLIDFWASWCGPCRAENPNVVNTFSKFKDKNFTVLSVSLDRAKQPWIDAIAMDGLNWTHVSDLKFWNNAVAMQFGISSIPQNLLLDPQGNLIGKNLRGAALEYRLSKVLK